MSKKLRTWSPMIGPKNKSLFHPNKEDPFSYQFGKRTRAYEWLLLLGLEIDPEVAKFHYYLVQLVDTVSHRRG